MFMSTSPDLENRRAESPMRRSSEAPWLGPSALARLGSVRLVVAMAAFTSAVRPERTTAQEQRSNARSRCADHSVLVIASTVLPELSPHGLSMTWA